MPDLIAVAISTVSDGSMYTPTDPKNEIVIKNRDRFLSSHGMTLETAARVCVSYDNQTDFCKYRVVSRDDAGLGMTDAGQTADALVTTDSGLALFLPLADCIGTVLYDEANHVLMLSHLGRHSLEQNGGQKSVEYLVKNYGSDPSTIKVWLTPAPSKAIYPIFKLDNKGMKEALFEQLSAAGIHRANITDNPSETDTDSDYFSYTNYVNGRSKSSGRYAIVAMINY
jgi:copper oxidase (laccase) domain-containing protein